MTHFPLKPLFCTLGLTLLLILSACSSTPKQSAFSQITIDQKVSVILQNLYLQRKNPTFELSRSVQQSLRSVLGGLYEGKYPSALEIAQLLEQGNIGSAREALIQLNQAQQRVDVKQQLSAIYFFQDLAQAKTLLLEALQMAPTNLYVRHQYGALALLQDEEDAAMAQFSFILSRVQRMPKTPWRGIAFMNLGISYEKKGATKLALQYYQRALTASTRLQDKSGMNAALSSIGNAYLSLERPQLAITSYKQALELNRNRGDRLGEARQLNNLGVSHEQLDDLGIALDFYQNAINVFTELGSPYAETVRNNINQLQQKMTVPEIVPSNFSFPATN